MVTGFLFVLCLGLQEDRPSLILERRVSSLRKAAVIESHKTRNPDHIPNLKTFVELTVTRPIRLLFTEPIVVMVS